MATQSPLLMAPSYPVTVQRSPWHSPIPYLFGGLAAMMALIIFALVILACSYRKLSRRLRDQADLEAGVGEEKTENEKKPTVFEDAYVVIMAGNEKPTFLATPSSSRTSSFGSNSCETMVEKDESGDRVQVSTMGNHESEEHAS